MALKKFAVKTIKITSELIIMRCIQLQYVLDAMVLENINLKIK
jgi:hypothetical protein